VDNAWILNGGVGRPPVELEPILQQAHPGGSAFLIGDLPRAVEQPLCATLLLRVLVQGQRALYVSEDAPALRARVRDALAASGGWPVGPLLSGSGELSRALLERLTPAAIFVTAEELDTEVVPLLAGATGHRFLESLACVVLGHPDQHLPIAATHLYFTLRRLSLLLKGAPPPAIIATGDGTAGTRRFIEELAGRTVLLVRNGLPPSNGVRVFKGLLPGGGRRALQQLAAEGARVAVEDPEGHFEEGELRSVAPETALAARPSFQRDVSLAVIDERWIARLFRMASLLPPHVQGQPHISVWWVPETPLSRFLLRPDMLRTLQERNELTTPRVLLGRRNRWLINAHMDAALLEAAHAENDLRMTFGDAAVNERIQNADLHVCGTVARVDPATNGLLRSSLCKASTDRVIRKERRTTITRDVIRVEDEESGTLLTTVDRRILPTRYYPRRVFAQGARRFTVSPDAYSDGLPRERLRVKPGTDRDSLTAPILDIRPTFVEMTTEPVRMDRGDFTIAVGAAAVSVTETVQGCVTLDAQATTIRYSPVSTREPYETRAALVFLQAARSLDGLIIAHLGSAQEDVEILDALSGFADVSRPALLFVDRHIGGMGVAEALPPDVVHELLRWARALLASCPNMSCLDGCTLCTPAEVLKQGPDKQGVLQMLGATQARASVA
jgi:hypothetical protein